VSGLLPKVGDRIVLVRMEDDPAPLEPGIAGTVDWIGEHTGLGFDQIGVRWDNGRSLLLCVPPDRWRYEGGSV
jgi:hypothetical protein